MMDTENKLQAVELRCIRQQKSLFMPVSFTLKAGDILLIEGPNGSGKSSLLRILTGLAAPASGELCWQGQSIQRSSYWEHLHYIGHANGIKLGLTVNENLRLATQLANVSAFDPVPLLDQLQLRAYQHTQVAQLSAGQKRRVALAKLFLIPKTLWILDEPLTALDTNTQVFFLSHLEKHLKNGGIAIISSHHPIHFNQAALQSLRLSSC